MITEDYCSFELCKLLKEKGFDSPVQCIYDEYGVVSERWTVYSDNYVIRHWQTPCVTHQMAMKWLREVHCLTIDIFHYRDWKVIIKTIPNDYLKADYDNDELKPSETYEQACEVAIKYCLTNLIK